MVVQPNVNVEFLEHYIHSINRQVSAARKLGSVVARTHQDPVVFAYEVRADTRPRVLVIDINAQKWSVLKELEITIEDTQRGKVAGIVLAERVFRVPGSELANSPIIFLTELDVGPWLNRVEALRALPGAPIKVVPKGNEARFESDLKEMVDQVRASQRISDNDIATTGVVDSQPSTPPAKLEFLNSLIRFWNLPAEMRFILLGISTPDEKWLYTVLDGTAPAPTRDLDDRLKYLMDIRFLMANFLRDPVAENSWLREPVDELKGRSPIELLASGTMEDLLMLRSYAYHICGF